MKKIISMILALSTSMTLLCCNAYADNTIDCSTVTDQLYSGFTDEIFKTTTFGGNSLKSDAVVTSAEQLYDYMSVFYDSDTTNSYVNKYNDAFFENNVLFLNSLYQGGGTAPCYEVKDVALSDSRYTVYGQWDYPEIVADVISVLLVQISVPKDIYNAHPYEAVWKDNYNTDITFTSTIDDVGYYSDTNDKGSAVITSVSELNDYISYLNDTQKQQYLKKYDDKFFEANVIFINTVYQHAGEIPYFTVKNVCLTDGEFFVNCKWNYPNEDLAQQATYLLVLVSISKDDYNSSFAVRWNIKKQTAYSITIDQFFSEYTDEVFTKQDHCAAVTDIKQLKDYLSKYYNSDVVDKYCNIYNEEFFENNFVILNSFTQGAGLESLLEIYSFGEVTYPEYSCDVKHYNVEGSMIIPDYDLPEVESVLLVQIPLAKGAYNPNLPVNWNIGTVNVKTEPNSDTSIDEKEYPLAYGDIDLDGKVSMRDSLKIMRSCIGLETLSEVAQACADVNGDGKVSAADSLEIQRYCINAKANAKIGTGYIL